MYFMAGYPVISDQYIRREDGGGGGWPEPGDV